jgi:hypothetical protein
MSPCLRKRNGHFAPNLLQFSQADTSVDNALAVWANGYQVSQFLCRGSVIGYVPPRNLRMATSDAVDFPRTTRLFVLAPTCLKKCGKIMAQNQDRVFLAADWKSSFDPPAHGILVSAEQIGGVPYRVITVDFDTAMVGPTFSHDG